MSLLHILKSNVTMIKNTAIFAIADDNLDVANALQQQLKGYLRDVVSGDRTVEDHAYLIESAEGLLDLIEEAQTLVIPKGYELCPVCEKWLKLDTEIRCTTCHEQWMIEQGYMPEPDTSTMQDISDEITTHDEYYEQKRGDKLPGVGDVSRDDQNRHQREKALGFAPPSADWAQCHMTIRCIHPEQVITRAPAETDVFHNSPSAWQVDNDFDIDTKLQNSYEHYDDFNDCIMCRHLGSPKGSDVCTPCLEADDFSNWAPAPYC